MSTIDTDSSFPSNIVIDERVDPLPNDFSCLVGLKQASAGAFTDQNIARAQAGGPRNMTTEKLMDRSALIGPDNIAGLWVNLNHS